MIAAGQTIGNYRILNKIGTGGMGAVYLAEHPLIGKRVALKVIHRELAGNRDVVSRFFQEARAVNKIGNDHIVEIHDFGVTPEGDHFFIMEYLEGKTLAAILAKGAMEMMRSLHVGAQIAGALSAAHVAGIIHRDLKPDNIMLMTRLGDQDFVKVLDFGLAKVFSAATAVKTAAGVLLGTPQYMSPEACESRGDVDHRTDIYALGVLLFQMMTGVLPFDGESMGEVLVKQVTALPPAPRALNPAIPPSVEQILLRCLAKPVDARFATMMEVREALLDPEAYLRGSPPIAPARQISRSEGLGEAKTAMMAAAPYPGPQGPGHGHGGHAGQAGQGGQGGHAGYGGPAGYGGHGGQAGYAGPAGYGGHAGPAAPGGHGGPGGPGGYGGQGGHAAPQGPGMRNAGPSPSAPSTAASAAPTMIGGYGDYVPGRRVSTGMPALAAPQEPKMNTMRIATPMGYSSRPARKIWPIALVVALFLGIIGGAVAVTWFGDSDAAAPSGDAGATQNVTANAGSAATASAGSAATANAGSAATTNTGSAAAQHGVPGGANAGSARVAKAHLSIESVPPGATVLGPDGQVLGRTPLSIDWPTSTQLVIFELRLAGYRRKQNQTAVTGNTALRIELERATPIRRPIPDRGRPVPNGSAGNGLMRPDE